MSSGAPRLSIVIPAYNAAATIAACLDALEAQTVGRETYEVIVVDDGSSDATRAAVERHAQVLYLEQAHAGPAAARNVGARRAGGEILLFTDADCVPAPDWIERMAAPFADPEIAGVKGAYTTQQQALVPRFVQLEYEDKYDRMARDRYIDFVDTYAAAYRRDVFLATGGFDTGFPTASVEDQEFSFRLARHGHKMVFARGARVRHLGHAGSVAAYWRKKFRIGYWKVLVTARHPEKVLRDSHTPQSLKLQILLAALDSLALLGAIRWRFARRACGAVTSLLLLSMVPFTLKAAEHDAAVALISPVMLLARALALGTGYAAGTWDRLMHREMRGQDSV